MTIAVSIKVNDGLVLGADSASTLMGRNPDGSTGVIGVYNNANKIVNLHKQLPLGVQTWGAGAIGAASMTTIFKDFRAMLCGGKEAPGGASWKVDPKNYTVATIAELLRDYVAELYDDEFGTWSDPPYLGMMVAGYSSHDSAATEYQIDLSGIGSADLTQMRPGTECGFTANGQPEAISRLIFGVDPSLPGFFHQAMGLEEDQALEATRAVQQTLQYDVIQPAMPIQDAIDLARFLVELTIQAARFNPGPDTVGGPVELAAITKHEGFKWVKRKHYFDRSINPEDASWTARQ